MRRRGERRAKSVALRRAVKLHAQRILLRRSAIRVCQPGPVAFHRSITSTGSRSEINFRGLAERGRPPLFTTARSRLRLVSSGNSLYSCDRIAWTSTLERSDFKVGREECFFTIIGLSHAEYMTDGTPRRVADHDEATGKQPITNDAGFAVVPAPVFDFNRCASEDDGRVLEVQAALRQRPRPFERVEGHAHRLL